jgi:hypothetical protein
MGAFAVVTVCGFAGSSKPGGNPMKLGCFLSYSAMPTVALAMLSSCAGNVPADNRPPAHDPIEILIKGLASRFPPLHEDGYWGSFDYGDSPTQDARSADAKRVQVSYGKLRSLGIKAFPELVAASDDKRYSFSQVVAAWNNLSVGDACFEIMESQVDFWGSGYKSRIGADGHYAAKPLYLWKIRQDGALRQWWAQHRAASLRDLQLESLHWTIRQEQSIGFVDEHQRQKILSPLYARLAQLDADDAAAARP